MNILIAGATGLIGQALVKTLQHDITILTTRKKAAKQAFPNYNVITWQEADDLETAWVGQFDVVINLAGYNIATKKWSPAVKKSIIDSRVQATTKIATWCAQANEQAPRLLNASAIGIYGLQKTLDQQNAVTYDENSTPPQPATDFLSEVGNAWEHALTPAEQAGVAIVKMRFAVVLSKQGGALAKMLLSFKLGMGGKIGTGKQPFSWISLDDVVNGILWLLEHPEISGPVNFVAPEITSQAEFAKGLAGALHRPCIFPLPSIIVKTLFGQMGDELLLNGQRVENTILQKNGFKFSFPSIKSLMSSLFA